MRKKELKLISLTNEWLLLTDCLPIGLSLTNFQWPKLTMLILKYAMNKQKTKIMVILPNNGALRSGNSA